jgi:hypothetical protein
VSFYRKRPLVIEARLFGEDNGADIAAWSGGRFVTPTFPGGSVIIVVPTLEGEMTAFPGDWIIKGVIGEFYPVKADVFQATYEPAGGAP